MDTVDFNLNVPEQVTAHPKGGHREVKGPSCFCEGTTKLHGRLTAGDTVGDVGLLQSTMYLHVSAMVTEDLDI